jgi:hypothetical protein
VNRMLMAYKLHSAQPMVTMLPLRAAGPSA